jgi:inner membrane protein
MMPWWGLAIVSAALGLAELHLPGAYLIWIALGAALTAAVEAAFGLSAEGQIVVLLAASALSCLAGFFVYGKIGRHRSASDALNRRDLTMIGQAGVLCAPVVNGQGKVRIGDTVWLAEGPDLPDGTPVLVKSVRATRLIVARAPAVEPASSRS